MEIEQGFGRFDAGEEIYANIKDIRYTKNGRPYAVLETDEGNFNVNIGEQDAHLPKGRYKIRCTNKTENGYCYLDFTKAQHTDWDKRDEAIQEVRQREHIEHTTTTPQNNTTYAPENPTAIAIHLTDQYAEKLVQLIEPSPRIKEHVDEIYKELYSKYGSLVYEQKQVEEEEIL